MSDHDLWHRRLCHIGDTALEELASDKVVTGVKIKDSEPRAFCDSCAVGKRYLRSQQIGHEETLQILQNRMCQNG